MYIGKITNYVDRVDISNKENLDKLNEEIKKLERKSEEKRENEREEKGKNERDKEEEKET